MNTIENYLNMSGYDAFLSPLDLFEISFEKLQNKTSSELRENGDFYFIIQGSLDIFYPDKTGKNHLIARVYPQDYQLIGISKYFKKKLHNLNDYIVSYSSDSILYGINRQKAESLFKDYTFIEFIFENFFNYSSYVVQENYFKSVFSLEEYLAYILYNHSTNNEYRVRNFSLFANLLKCDRTNLYRALSSLKKQGVIEKNGKIIKILCREKLKYTFEEKI